MPPRKDYLLAWNPLTRKAAFTVPGRGGGVLTTAGNLIFQGRSRDGVLGTLVALRASGPEQEIRLFLPLPPRFLPTTGVCRSSLFAPREAAKERSWSISLRREFW